MLTDVNDITERKHRVYRDRAFPGRICRTGIALVFMLAIPFMFSNNFLKVASAQATTRILRLLLSESLSRDNFQKQEAADQLKLVDVKIVEPTNEEKNRFPKLDLIVRNLGQVAVLKKAIFHVEHVWRWRSVLLPHAIKPSWNYTVELPVHGAPYTLPVDIAQEVPGNGTDRFTFTLGNDASPIFDEFIFLCRLEIIFNEDNKVLSTPTFLFISSAPIVPLASTDPGNSDLRISVFVHNILVLKEVRSFQGVLSPKMQEILKDWPEDVVPDLLKGLKNGDERQREYSAKFLGKLGYAAKGALSDLQQVAANDQSQKVRVAAESAIGMIKAAKENPVPLVIDPDIHKKDRAASEALPGKGPNPNSLKLPVTRTRISAP